MATYKSEILIGGESVWGTQDSVSKRTVQLDVSRFTGRKELKFKIERLPDSPTPPPPPPSCPATEPDFWTFDGAGDYLKLLYTDPAVADFNPAMNSNDFSVAGMIKPADVMGTNRGILTKTVSPEVCWAYANKCGWSLYHAAANIRFQTSQTGAGSTIISQGGLAAGVKSFVGAVYHYNGVPGANSYGKVWCDAAWTESNAMNLTSASNPRRAT